MNLKWLFYTVGALVLIYVGVEGYSCVKSGQLTKEVVAAQVDKSAATAAQKQAVGNDDQASKDRAQVAKSDAQAPGSAAAVATADAKVATLRKAMAPALAAPALPGIPGAEPLAAAPSLAPLVAAQQEEITALKAQVANQAQQIADRDNLISSLTLARDAWQASANASAAEAVQLRAAMAAQAGLIRAAEIKGFLIGFAVGNGTGAGAVAILKH